VKVLNSYVAHEHQDKDKDNHALKYTLGVATSYIDKKQNQEIYVVSFGSMDLISLPASIVTVILRTEDGSKNEMIERDREEGVEEVLTSDTES
jgi:hypothetical protein